MKDQGSLVVRRKPRQHRPETLDSLLRLCLPLRIIARQRLKLREHVIDIHDRGSPSLAQRVLMDHMARNREQVGLRAANGLLVLDPQEPEKDLLREVLSIRDAAQPNAQEASQAIAILRRDGCNESVPLLIAQGMARPLDSFTMALERFGAGNGYGPFFPVRAIASFRGAVAAHKLLNGRHFISIDHFRGSSAHVDFADEV